jgi:hypothetical protein
VDQRRRCVCRCRIRNIAVEVRVRLADIGIEVMPETSDQLAPAPRRPATAQAN